MWKVKNTVLNDWIHKKLTHSEVVVMFYFALHQSEAGWARGMYYERVAMATGISKSSYYNACDGLAEKGLIHIEKMDYRDRDIRIINNDFRDKDFRSGYLDMYHKIFHDPEFWKMKGNEILLALDLLKIYSAGKRAYIIGVQTLLEKYASIFDVQKRTIKEYLHAIKEYFTINIRDKKYSISAKRNKVYETKYETTGTGEAEAQRKYTAQVACSRAGIQEYKQKELEETAALLCQYRKHGTEDELANKLSSAVKRSIQIINENLRKKSEWKYVLNCKLIHKLFRNELSIQ